MTVIEFAGDALLCLFLDRGVRSCRTDQERARCCARGLKCSLALTKFHDDDIDTHVSLSFGTVSLALLGGYCGKHTYVMNGDCVDQAGVCIGMAGMGELVVTQEVYDTLSEEHKRHYVYEPIVASESSSRRHVSVTSCVDVHREVCYKVTQKKRRTRAMTLVARPSASLQCDRKTKNDFARWESYTIRRGSSSLCQRGDLNVEFTIRKRILQAAIHIKPSFRQSVTKSQDQCTLADIISCVPQLVREAVVTNAFRGLSELRAVTTLFLKLDTYSTDRFHNLADLQPIFLAMQMCLEKCGGLLRQFIIDDKGCVLIGLWGVPGASYPGNCSRAVRCAWMMKAEASVLHHSVSIGITTGSVYCGVIGTDYRRDYVAIGNSVNLAARLMSHANGRILLDESTLDKLPLDITYNTKLVKNLAMKGVQAECSYYSYTSAVIPSMTDTYVHSDKMMVFSSQVREQVVVVLGMLDTAMQYFSSGLTDKQSFSFILIVKGISGSGKSATLRHLVRRVKAHISTHYVETPTLGPLYISVKVDDNGTGFKIIRHIIEAAWICSGCLSDENKMIAIANFLTATYASTSPEFLKTTVLPAIREALSLSLPYPACMVHSRGTERADTPEIPDEIEILAALTKYVLESSRVTVVAMDDVHNMSTAAWCVLTKLLIRGCRTIFLWTLCVHEAYERVDPSRDHLVYLNMSTERNKRSTSVAVALTDRINSMTRTDSQGDTDTTLAIK